VNSTDENGVLGSARAAPLGGVTALGGGADRVSHYGQDSRRPSLRTVLGGKKIALAHSDIIDCTMLGRNA
jgi:hypothetical protein